MIEAANTLGHSLFHGAVDGHPPAELRAVTRVGAPSEQGLHGLFVHCAGQAKLDGLLAYPGPWRVAAALVVAEQSLPWVRCVLGCYLVREIPKALPRADPADTQHFAAHRFSDCD